MFQGIKEGDVVSAVVLIKGVFKNKTRQQKDYLRLTINDGKNDITAFMWDAASCEFKEGDVVKLKGSYGTYDDKPKIDVVDIKATDEKIKLKSLSEDEMSDCLKRFKKLRDKIKDEDFAELCASIFDNEAIWEMYTIAPGAKGNHHAYLGGLLQHSVEVAEQCYALYKADPAYTNISLLLAGALLHDIGKIKEYEYEKKLDRTTSGKLIGHTSLGLLIISRLLPDGFPIKKSTELIHLILSHHGKRDWGAPVEPLMKEAVILHNCDMNASYAGRFNLQKENSKNHEWSSYDKTYNRSWYLKTTED